MKAQKHLFLIIILMISSLSANAQNMKYDKFPVFIHKDYKDFPEWVSGNFVSPEWVKKEEKEIIIYASFTVKEGGQIEDVSILRSTNHALDEYVIGLIASSPRWVPAKKDKEPVSMELTVPIIIKRSTKKAAKVPES
jgi:hypothetical protein